MVEVSLTVGKLDASLALLLTKDHHLIEFPTLLLPENVEAGSIIKISCERDQKEETANRQIFDKVQSEIVEEFGVRAPSQPKLQIRNITQTSVVLEWDKIDVATAKIKSLTLYKNNARFGVITNPLQRTSTKISGLAIDSAYTFHLKLATTAGTFVSEVVSLKTSKMTDLTGITMCVGSLEGSQIDREQLGEIANKIGAKPLQDAVKVDTTHFVCTRAEGAQCIKAQELNIPVVTPEWVKACETERRLVGVTAYYLDADPKNRPPLPRTVSQTTTTSGSRSTIPQLKVTEPSVHEDKKSLDFDKPVPELPTESRQEEPSNEESENSNKTQNESEARPAEIEPIKEENEVRTEKEPVEPTPIEDEKPVEPAEGSPLEPIEEKAVEPNEETPVEPAKDKPAPANSQEVEETNGDANTEPANNELKAVSTSETEVVEDLIKPEAKPEEEISAVAKAPEPKKKKKKNKKKKNASSAGTAPEVAPEEMDDVEL